MKCNCHISCGHPWLIAATTLIGMQKQTLLFCKHASRHTLQLCTSTKSCQLTVSDCRPVLSAVTQSTLTKYEPIQAMKHLSKLSPNRVSFAHVALAYQGCNPVPSQRKPYRKAACHKICTELIGSIVSGACASSLQVT